MRRLPTVPEDQHRWEQKNKHEENVIRAGLDVIDAEPDARPEILPLARISEVDVPRRRTPVEHHELLGLVPGLASLP